LSKKKNSNRLKRLNRMRHRPAKPSRSIKDSFYKLVEDALCDIPEPFVSKLENVAVVVEDEPTDELLSSLGIPAGETLFGLYDGIPLTDRGEAYNLVPPDRILIFRKPILEACSSPEEIREQVRTTVLHEVAHYYGISEEELAKMGLS
jgi:predicted Zn-dependent protease with MMP-like domain